MKTPFLDQLIKEHQNHIESVESASYAGVPKTRKQLAELEAIKAITVTHCCTPKGAVKTIDFERTIDLLDAEIDSLKDAYHQETIADRKTQYSSMILESLHAKKKLKQ